MGLEILEVKAKKKTDFPPLLFVHGMCHAAWCWRENFMPYFAEKGFDSYAVSLRSHGKSDSDKPLHKLSIADYVTDVENVVKHIGEMPVLVGHSMGGFITQHYLVKHPVKAAILLTPSPYNGVKHASNRPAMYHRVANWVLSWKKSFMFTLNTLPKARRAMYSKDLPKDLLQKYFERLDDESITAFFDMQKEHIPINYHSKVPMLVVAADNDRLLSVKCVEDTAKYYGADFVLMQNTAHNVMLDTRWEIVADRVFDWVSVNVGAEASL